MVRLLSSFFIFIVLMNCRSNSSSAEGMIQTFMAEGKIPGLFVAVVKDDSVLYQNSFGLADIESGKSITDTTCMELGSISKAFVAEIIFDLQHSHLLDINDAITKYLPNAPTEWAKITIRHLLMHTSGIQNYLLDPRFKAADYFTNSGNTESEVFFSTISTDSLVQMFFTLPLEFNPGATWSYSNTGYILLGKIAEKVTGKPFFDLAMERLIRPLGMQSTKANELAFDDSCLARGYFIKDNKQHAARVLTTNYAFSAGAWATNGRDMIQYLKAIHRKVLPSDKIASDIGNFTDSAKLPFNYYGGRFYSTFHGMKIISHNGGTPGFSSSWIYVPDKKISIIVLINMQDYAGIDDMAWNILSLYESSLTYPDKRINGSEEDKWAAKLVHIIQAIKNNQPPPAGLSQPLHTLLKTENGKGLWNWYFGKGFPSEAYCVDVESLGESKIFRFKLPYSQNAAYRIALQVNPDNEIVQMRWW